MTLSDFILAFKALEKETRGKCFYCGTQTQRGGHKPHHAVFQTHDHVIPRSALGSDLRTNRVVCCRKCNALKADLTLPEFKLIGKIQIFYAEELLGMRIEKLEDFETVTIQVLSNRKTNVSPQR